MNIARTTAATTTRLTKRVTIYRMDERQNVSGFVFRFESSSLTRFITLLGIKTVFASYTKCVCH